ncbi:hypothetical protein VTH82DRAFT_2320 [Thermothelomyces myriococcoides]
MVRTAAESPTLPTLASTRTVTAAALSAPALAQPPALPALTVATWPTRWIPASTRIATAVEPWEGTRRTSKSGATSDARRDPTDAAQVPPSVLRKHLGEPLIEHSDATHHRERRNSIKSHQETFRGI